MSSIVTLWKELMAFHLQYDERFQFLPNADRAFERHIISSMRSRGVHILVAESGDEIVGYIMGEIHSRQPIFPIGEYGFISDISVHEAWRRQGIGRSMVEGLMEWFHKCHVTAVELFAANRNPISGSFWRAMGFTDFLLLLRRDIPDTTS